LLDGLLPITLLLLETRHVIVETLVHVLDVLRVLVAVTAVYSHRFVFSLRC